MYENGRGELVSLVFFVSKDLHFLRLLVKYQGYMYSCTDSLFYMRRDEETCH